MRLGASGIAERGEQIGHAAMGMDMAGIDLQRRFEMRARRRVLAKQEQKVRQVDAAIGIGRMPPHRFAEQGPRGLAVAGIEHERAKIVQRRKVIRLAADQLQIIALGVLETALLAQQSGAFGARAERLGIALQHAIKLA